MSSAFALLRSATARASSTACRACCTLSLTISVTTSFAAELVMLTARYVSSGVTRTVCQILTNLNQKLRKHKPHECEAKQQGAKRQSSMIAAAGVVQAGLHLLHTNNNSATAGFISAISASSSFCNRMSQIIQLVFTLQRLCSKGGGELSLCTSGPTTVDTLRTLLVFDLLLSAEVSNSILWACCWGRTRFDCS